MTTATATRPVSDNSLETVNEPTDTVNEPASTDAEHVSKLFGRDALYMALWGIQLLAAAALTPLITRLMGAAEFGAVATANAVMQVLFVIAGVGLQTAIQRHYARGRGGEADARRLLMLCILLAAIVTALVDQTGRWWCPIVGFHHYGGALRLAVLWAGAAAITAASLALLRCQDRLLAFAAVSLLQSVVASGASLLLIRGSSASATHFLLGQVALQIAAATLALVLAPPKLMRLRDVTMAREGLRYALPLVPAVLSTFVLASADRFVVGGLLGQTQVARYQIAYNVGSAPILLLAVLNSAWMPRFFGLTDDTERAALLARSRDALYKLLAPVVVGLAVAAPVVLKLWAPTNYRPDQLVITTAIVVVSAVPFAAGLASTRTLLTAGQTPTIAAASIIAAAVNVGGNLALVPRFGLTGSAVTTALSYTLMYGILQWRARKFIQVAPTSRRVASGLGAAVVFAVAISLVPEHLVLAPVRAVVILGSVVWFVVLMLELATGRPLGAVAAARLVGPRAGRHRAPRPDVTLAYPEENRASAV